LPSVGVIAHMVKLVSLEILEQLIEHLTRP
jgi:hypothetical protein